jgi:predicted amidohydrolase
MAEGAFMLHLEVADSLLDLARRLGAACLERESELAEMASQTATARELWRLEEWAARPGLAVWEEVIADPSRFEERFGTKVVASLRRTRTRYPLDCLGVVRGLCRRPLAEFFATTLDQVSLDHGLPVPFATRPLPGVLGDHCTTSLATLNSTSLLYPLPYDFYGPLPGGQVRVVLDYAHRDRVDELTWDDEAGLPKIATAHPVVEGGFDFTVEGDRFFDVRPKEWDPEAVRKLLGEAKTAGATLVVLPELSLPRPDAVEDLIARDHASFPPIVVAGSAHVEEFGGAEPIRANEARIYLDGKFVARARKHHGFRTKEIAGETYPEALLEDLSREQKTIMVLSGTRTRLAVVICADLQEAKIPALLVAAGVNLLLVPTMTQRIGSFNTPLSQVAGLSQGVAVLANTRWGDDGRPFLCFCAVPREAPAEQTAALPDDGSEPAPVLGVFDPNLPLPGAVSWL